MSDAQKEASTRQDKSGITLIVIGFILVSLSLYFYLDKGNSSASNLPSATNIPAAPTQAENAPSSATITAPISVQSNTQKAPIVIDSKTALAPRTLGSDDAPIKIYEYASLSCGHCALFHLNTLPKFKKDYIDTGKAQLIYSDFPLNGSALMGSMVARCLPEEQYFPFLKTLFTEQENWAFTQEFPAKLKALAAQKTALDEKSFEACINNEEIKQGLITNMQATARQWKINSTPSFLVNNKETISGAQSYEDFVKRIEDITAETTTE